MSREQDVKAIVVGKVYWNLLPWLFTSGLVVYIDRSNIAYAAPAFKKDLHLSNFEYGVGSGIFYAGYAALAIPSNIVISYVGGRTWLPAITLLWGVVAACNAAANNAHAFWALRFLLGAAEAGNYPGMWYHLALFLSKQELSWAYAVILSAAVLSQVIGGPIAAGLLLMEGVGGLHGWQWLFLLEGALTLLYGVTLAVGLADTPATAGFLSGEERRWLDDRQKASLVAREAEHARSSSAWAPLVSLRMWWLCIAWMLMGAAVTNLLVWTPLILEAALSGSFGGQTQPAAAQHVVSLREQAWHTSKLALITTTMFVPTGVAMLGIGWSCTKHGKRRWHSVVPLTISGLAFMCVPAGMRRGAVAGFALLVVAAMGVWGAYGPLVSWPNAFLQGRAAAVGLAMFNASGSIGGLSPFVIGFMANSGSYIDSMYLLGSLVLAAALMLLVFREARPHVRPGGSAAEMAYLPDAKAALNE